jgi:hypothetical protein
MEPIEAREKNLQETPDLNPTLKLDTKKKNKQNLTFATGETRVGGCQNKKT